MKNTWKLFLLLGILLFVGLALVSQMVVSVAQDATALPTLAPTPIGGGENGVIYQHGGQDNILSFQKDLSDPTSVISVLSAEQLSEAFGKTFDYALIHSISPDGKMVDIWPLEPKKQTPYGEYVASVDMSFRGRLTNGHLDHIQFWSPDSMGVLSKTSTGVFIVRRGKRNVISYYVQGNFLTWSKDGTEVYLYVGRDRLLVFDVTNGSQKRIKVGFMEEINAALQASSKQELIWELSFSPVSDDVLLGTVNDTRTLFTIYKTTSDFTDASVLATFNSNGCTSLSFGYDSPRWSPNGEYVFFIPNCNDSIILNVGDGSAIVKNKFNVNGDDGSLIRYPCGWSPDNHLVTVQFTHSGDDILSFWDPTQLDEPVLNMPYSGYLCPVWLPPPAAN